MNKTFTCSNKKTVQALITSCYKNNIKKVVLSPGSRNAPLIISFGNHPEFECFTIADERSAAFYALGMARKLNEPVALVCTSGSAVLNYAPAIVEAYYQQIPLVVITADRPPELIDQEDGQTIRQPNIYANYIKQSLNLPVCASVKSTGEVLPGIDNIINLSVNAPQSPVHINIPFYEPLYNTEQIIIAEKSQKQEKESKSFIFSSELKNIWHSSAKKIIVIGAMQPDKKIEELLHRLNLEQKAVVISSPLSNIKNPALSTTPDPLFFSRVPDSIAEYKPDLLITIGSSVVSKFMKQFFRYHKPVHHWDIDINHTRIDTYGCLTEKIEHDTLPVLEELVREKSAGDKEFYNKWVFRKIDIAMHLNTVYSKAQWSDLLVFKTFFDSVQEPVELHLANSTPVRYAEFFTKHPDIVYMGNRGTSGIDGSLSTAAGAAMVSWKPVYLITGDMSFIYDSNALWNSNLPNNFKIIIINNGGGNIFKVLKGPSDTEHIDKFVANTPVNIAKLCNAYGVNYFSAINVDELNVRLLELYETQKCTVLEVFTDSDTSAAGYRDIFKDL